MKFKNLEITGFFLLIIGLISSTFWAQQNTFSNLFFSISIAFLGYFILTSNSHREKSVHLLIFIGILLRILVLFELPTLTDDFYRFYWDGWLNASSVNPYLYTPREVFHIMTPPSGLFNQLNSPDYYSIYPPLVQKFFHLAYLMANGNIEAFIFWAKWPLFFGEVITLFLIPKILSALGKNEILVNWYIFNPLIIIELLGNLHYEVLAITGLSLGIYGILYHRSLLSVLGVSFAVGVKLIPLITLPFFVFFWNWKIRLASGLLLLFFFKDLFRQEELIHFFASLNLYFQKFEFNGGLYFFAREIGTFIIGYNPIAYLGPGLQLLGMCLMGFWFFKWLRRGKDLQLGLEMIFFWLLFYFLFSTTVHPWYLGIPIFLSVFLSFRFVFYWSWLIFLSYFHYNGEGYQEALWVPILEYGIVWLLMGYEIKKRWNCTSQRFLKYLTSTS